MQISFKFRGTFIQSIIQLKDSFCAPAYAWQTGLYKFYQTSAQMDTPCIKCFLEEFWKTNSQNSQTTEILRYFKYILTIKLMIKYCICILLIQFSATMETVNTKIWCSSSFKKEIYNCNVLFSSRTHFHHLCTIYNRRKNFISLREIVQDWFRTFRFRQHFQTLKFWPLNFRDCFKPANKVKSYFLGDCVFLKIKLTFVNQLLQNIIKINE